MEHWGKKITTFFLIHLENLYRNKFKIPENVRLQYCTNFTPQICFFKELETLRIKRNIATGSDFVKVEEKRKTGVLFLQEQKLGIITKYFTLMK
jgi:hypothetical protein